jgi:hypothetical protein
MHRGLLEYCKSKGWLSSSATAEQLDWKSIMTESSGKEKELEPSGRERLGSQLLTEHLSCGYSNKEDGLKSREKSFIDFAFNGMANVLRDDVICMQGGFQTTGSQISIISSSEIKKSVTESGPESKIQKSCHKDVHFFTSYNPDISIYKPFIFPTIEQRDKECCIQNLQKVNEKTKTLWSMYHTMNRRDRKSVKDRLIAKEKEFICNIERIKSDMESMEGQNIFEECIDQEIRIIQS